MGDEPLPQIRELELPSRVFLDAATCARLERSPVLPNLERVTGTVN